MNKKWNNLELKHNLIPNSKLFKYGKSKEALFLKQHSSLDLLLLFHLQLIKKYKPHQI